jgi:hypothetical protein
VTTSVPPSNGISDRELADLFERGAVFADRWPTAVRHRLDVPDPLTLAVRDALKSGRHVVITGAAGDGKSHLAMTVLDDLTPITMHEVVRGQSLPTNLPSGTVVFLRDVSALTDDDVLAAIGRATEDHLALLLTINEGPLNTLAPQDSTGFLGRVREIIHRRSRGMPAPDPADAVIVNLSGRQLTRGDFVSGALLKILPVVRPCHTCGRSRNCPRVRGAQQLKRSRIAQERIGRLLQMLTDRGRHLTAREIWAFLIDLFFGWTCISATNEVEQQAGYFWNRVFDGENAIAQAILTDFDPLRVARARDDADLWRGNYEHLGITAPIAPPRVLARTDTDDGLTMFTSAKRYYFFFAKNWDVDHTLSAFVPARRFGALLERVTTSPDAVASELTGLINSFRLGQKTREDLWISRHHAFAAHRRPIALAASGKVPSSSLRVRVPFSEEAAAYPDSGFFPHRLLLGWPDSEQEFIVDFATWRELQGERNLIVDRSQETLDFGLDIFLAQGNPPDATDPEILVYDHRRRRQVTLRLASAERRVDVL